jgi:hypothetical protein
MPARLSRRSKIAERVVKDCTTKAFCRMELFGYTDCLSSYLSSLRAKWLVIDSDCNRSDLLPPRREDECTDC